MVQKAQNTQPKGHTHTLTACIWMSAIFGLTNGILGVSDAVVFLHALQCLQLPAVLTRGTAASLTPALQHIHPSYLTSMHVHSNVCHRVTGKADGERKCVCVSVCLITNNNNTHCSLWEEVPGRCREETGPVALKGLISIHPGLLHLSHSFCPSVIYPSCPSEDPDVLTRDTIHTAVSINLVSVKSNAGCLFLITFIWKENSLGLVICHNHFTESCSGRNASNLATMLGPCV